MTSTEERHEALRIHGKETLKRLKAFNLDIVFHQKELKHKKLIYKESLEELLENLATQLQVHNITKNDFNADKILVRLKDEIKEEVINFLLLEESPQYELIHNSNQTEKTFTTYSLMDMYRWEVREANRICNLHTINARNAIKVMFLIQYIQFTK
jgi:hypothetical protein